jgi:hypothetical protein
VRKLVRELLAQASPPSQVRFRKEFRNPITRLLQPHLPP